MDPLRLLSIFCFGLVLCVVMCGGMVINHGRGLSKLQETLLQEYRLEVARRMGEVRSGQDFLQIFVPREEVESTFVAMVNETVQMKNKGRFFGKASDVHFDLGISDKVMAEWLAHSSSVGCSEPTSILLDMYDELSLSRGTGDYLFPGCTWVRRCAGSGCCPSERQECASVPERRINVTRPFVRMSETFIDASGHVTHRRQFLNYTLYEDTACECRDRPEAEVPCAERPCTSPKHKFSVANCECKCRRRCPNPYTQDPATCGCDCAPGDRQCLKAMRGKIQLQPSQCSCVGHGCEQPKCRRHWTFSKSHCRCMERAPSPDRALPPGRARVLNEVPSSRTGIELLSEPASGMVAMVTASKTTTVSFSQTQSATDADVDENSSSSSSIDADGMEERLRQYPPYVRIPVEPERRFSGGRQQHQSETDPSYSDHQIATTKAAKTDPFSDNQIATTSTAKTDPYSDHQIATTSTAKTDPYSDHQIATTSPAMTDPSNVQPPMVDELPIDDDNDIHAITVAAAGFQDSNRTRTTGKLEGGVLSTTDGGTWNTNTPLYSTMVTDVPTHKLHHVNHHRHHGGLGFEDDEDEMNSRDEDGDGDGDGGRSDENGSGSNTMIPPEE